MLIELSPLEERVLREQRNRNRWASDLTGEIQAMRNEGLSIIGCTKLVVILTSCTFGEAKNIVNKSPAWADGRLDREQWEEGLAAEVENAFGPLQVAPPPTELSDNR